MVRTRAQNAVTAAPLPLPFMTADAAFSELQSIAALLESEATVCQQLSEQMGGAWSGEASAMAAFSYSSGISQIMHAERVLRLQVLQEELQGAWVA